MDTRYLRWITYWVSQNLPKICPASAQANMKHVLKQMQYRFTLIYEALSPILNHFI